MTKHIENEAVWELLWDSLDGGDYDLEALKTQVHEGSRFVEDMEVDSLDLVEFYLRVEDHFEVKIPEEKYPELLSVEDVSHFLEA